MRNLVLNTLIIILIILIFVLGQAIIEFLADNFSAIGSFIVFMISSIVVMSKI